MQLTKTKTAEDYEKAMNPQAVYRILERALEKMKQIPHKDLSVFLGELYFVMCFI
jgi:hypothetical protein